MPAEERALIHEELAVIAETAADDPDPTGPPLGTVPTRRHSVPGTNLIIVYGRWVQQRTLGLVRLDSDG